jgi:hypothetical protein
VRQETKGHDRTRSPPEPEEMREKWEKKMMNQKKERRDFYSLPAAASASVSRGSGTRIRGNILRNLFSNSKGCRIYF